MNIDTNKGLSLGFNHTDTPSRAHAATITSRLLINSCSREFCSLFLGVLSVLAYSTSLSHGYKALMRTLPCIIGPVIWKMVTSSPNRKRGRVAIVPCIAGLVGLSTSKKSISFELIKSTCFAAKQILLILLHAESWRSCQCFEWEVFS